MLGFTKQEQGIVLFLIFSLLVGSGVRLFRYYSVRGAVVTPTQESDEKFKTRAGELTQQSRLGSTKASAIAFLPPEPSEAAHLYNSSEEFGQTETPTAKIETKDDFDQFRVNINMATAKELEGVPKIGPVLARRIVDYRLEFGLFKDVEELKEVKGIGEKTFKKIESHITID